MEEYDNFIGVYPNAVPADLCDTAVALFEDAVQKGMAKSRSDYQPSDIVEDTQLFSNDYNVGHMSGGAYEALTNVLWECHNNYAKKYDMALTHATDSYSVYDMKMQRTAPMQGYHKWHYETSNRPCANRILAYTIYLNDIEEGGETEFLYYRKRIKAEKGTVAIFPAHFTHLHRGNPPLSGTKYIATGWFEF